MKRKFTYSVLVSIILLVCYQLVVDICGQASGATHIGFTSMRTGDNDIYVMEINGKDLQNLTNHLANDFSPSFSADGQWMAYVSKRLSDNLQRLLAWGCFTFTVSRDLDFPDTRQFRKLIPAHVVFGEQAVKGFLDHDASLQMRFRVATLDCYDIIIPYTNI